MPAEKTARLAYWAAAGGFLLAGALLRWYRIGEQLIIDDEWHALNVVQNLGVKFIFSHFGHADHSIPLTLLYEALQQTIGLSEAAMRAPSLLAGIAIIAVFPLLMKPWLSREERLLTTALLAISPFLINFSRVARPYALLALLASACLPLAWHWWQSRRAGAGWAWGGCAVLAGWLNPVSLAVTLAPFIWFGSEALAAGFRRRDWRPLRRLVLPGLGIGLTLFALLYVPLSKDFASLAMKSGQGSLNADTLIAMLGLYSGASRGWVLVLMGLLAATGFLRLGQRDRAFTAYLACAALASATAVWLSGAEWIQHGLVLARYLIGLLPFYLAMAAVGLAGLVSRLPLQPAARPAARLLFLVLAPLLLFTFGPVPSWDMPRSQFTHHLVNQLDFRPEHNDYRRQFDAIDVPAYYREIAAKHPAGDALVVEAPWYLESHWNPLPVYQQVHGQQLRVGFVGGVCARRLYGELREGRTGLSFRNFVRLGDLLNRPGEADYLVLRRSGLEGARDIDMRFDDCARAARAAFGAPWRETEEALVFRLRKNA
jgi:hypothetical protein